MNRTVSLACVVLGAVFLCTVASTSLLADDPLDAFPTAEKPVEDKVKRLTEEQLKAIELPKEAGQLVFSIKLDATPEEKDAGEKPEPFLRVFADGKIDCGHLEGKRPDRRTDQLTKDELTWLLHLAVNECQLLTRNTEEFKKQLQPEAGQPPPDPDFKRPFVYHLDIAAGANDFSVRSRSLIIQPVRARLKLNAFASLHKYANFLVFRAFLGNPKERQALLDELNQKLKADHPDLPAFRIEHLNGAVSAPMVDLVAVFQQEIELGENKYKRVSGNIIRKAKGDAPMFTTQTMDFSKYKPGASRAGNGPR